ncbi:MAG: type III-B CRISPR module-associated protein Cmr5 [Methanobacteriota archaeon]|nr:MAG: type III-B CRISPR module-associated protein Cmr5 [Euryarchaeota archaeon]
MTAITLDHERAQLALQAVQEIAEGDLNIAKKFRSYVESLPAIIVRNGLGQALAMEAANGKVGKKDNNANDSESTEEKKDKPDEIAHKKLYGIVSKWILQRVYGIQDEPSPLQVIDEIISSDQMTYMRAQEEALLLLQWVKRFANATIERDSND